MVDDSKERWQAEDGYMDNRRKDRRWRRGNIYGVLRVAVCGPKKQIKKVKYRKMVDERKEIW
jgi:hypothetical protein